jgi:hypothetical protein
VAVPEYIVKLPMNLIYCAASDYKLNTFLVAAIVVVESGGGTHKTRFEPTYPYLYGVEKYAKILQITQETEKVHQMTSWGLMQVMGSTAAGKVTKRTSQTFVDRPWDFARGVYTFASW